MRVESEPVLSRDERVVYVLLVAAWIVSNVFFWAWWFQPDRVGDPLLYGLFTAGWAYDASLLPSMYLFFVGCMRHPRHMPAASGLRVALISLCVPAQESLDVIEQQLAAMTRVSYPHESWILDEGHEPAVRAAAARHGVRYFSRHGIERYNQPSAPFRANTKAGNVNAWLDAHGAAYEFFVQFDIDHLARPDYLDQVLGYFDDDRVAWVQAPSLYANLDASWVARGAAEQELVLQGPLQRGFFGHSETPFIIGSHCTYRTSAINDIGGFQPTRAEDHLDTVMLAAYGYRGVFVPEPIAFGAGPEAFETYLRQQFAWALSMVQVLVGFTPRLLRRYTARQALQLLFAQTWYPLWSTSMLVLFTIPLLALLTGREPARSVLWQFAAASAPLTLTAFATWRWTRRWQLPRGLGLSWRGIVLHIARWPIVFWALLNVALRVRHPYMITPKGDSGTLPVLRLRSQAIYLSIAVSGLAVVWRYLLSDSDANVDGYALFALLGAAYMLCVVLTNVGSDLRELRKRGLGLTRTIKLRGSILLSVGVVSASLVGTASAGQADLLTAATWPSSQAAEDASTPGARAARGVLEGTRTIDNAHNSAVSQLDAPNAPVVIGAYDPWQDFTNVPLGIEQWYVRQDDPRLFVDALDHDPGRVPLITIEPFPHRARTPVLERVISGADDDQLQALARSVAERQPRIVLLRWGQEMDLSGLYPWSTNDPATFGAAFRHVVTVFRQAGATNARWVWSPAGEVDATAYYPGADVVDYVGLTVLGDAEWDRDLGYTAARSMSEILRPRYAEIVRLNTPVLLAEVGTSGSEDQQRAWLTAGISGLSEFPLVRAVVYFDDRNAPNNHRPTEPNWRVSNAVIKAALNVAAAIRSAQDPRGLHASAAMRETHPEDRTWS